MPQNGELEHVKKMDQRNDKTFSGARCLFQLLPEPFHGEHLQTPDCISQGEISIQINPNVGEIRIEINPIVFIN